MRHAVRHLPEEKQDRFMEIWNDASSQQKEFILNFQKYSSIKKMVEDDENNLNVVYGTVANWNTSPLVEASDLLRETKYIQMQNGFEELAPTVVKRLKANIESGSEKQSNEAIKIFMDHYSKNITKNDNSDNTININFVE